VGRSPDESQRRWSTQRRRRRHLLRRGAAGSRGGGFGGTERRGEEGFIDEASLLMMAFGGLSASWFSEGNSGFVGRPLVFVLLASVMITIGKTGVRVV